MPELPEVETVVRGLRRARLIGCRIHDVMIYWPRTIAGPTARDFAGRARGQRIQALSRRGKFILMALSGGDTLLIHLRMTGRLHFAAAGVPRSPHQHVVVRLDDDRELRYHDTRKFGRWWLTDAPGSIIGHLGPEPLSPGLTPQEFADAVRAHARRLKPLLLDQRVLAGLGNIYVDEALWDARLHPQRRSDTLKSAEARRLLPSIRRVLLRGLRSQGTTLGAGNTNFYSVAGRRGRNQDGLMVFRRTGAPCPRCRTPIMRIIVAQRSTHLCPRCQPLPRGISTIGQD